MPRSYLSEKHFHLLYSFYLNGQDMYRIAEDNWERYGYSSAESFRISFRAKCVRRGFPVRDVSSSRRKIPTGTYTNHGTITSEHRAYIKEQVSNRRKEIARLDKRLKIGYL